MASIVCPEENATTQIGEVGEEAYARFGLARIAQNNGNIERTSTIARIAYEKLSKFRPGHRLLTELESFLRDLDNFTLRRGKVS